MHKGINRLHGTTEGKKVCKCNIMLYRTRLRVFRKLVADFSNRSSYLSKHLRKTDNMDLRVLLLIVLALCTIPITRSTGVEEMSDFKPSCVRVDLSSKEVRPGGCVSATFRFRNDGKTPASADYWVYVHLEYSSKDCSNIVVNEDHQPSIPTTDWLPGMMITDGAYLLSIPVSAQEGVYYLHVGVYSRWDPGYPRFSDQYVGEIYVSKSAPKVKVVPPRMSSVEVAKRRAQLHSRVSKALMLEDDHLRFMISAQSGTWMLLDKMTGEVWTSSAEYEGMGRVELADGRRHVRRNLDTFSEVQRSRNEIRLTCPIDVFGESLPISVTIRLLPARKGLCFSYEDPRHPDGWEVEEIRLLDGGLLATDKEKGYFAVPNRLGILFPAEEGLPCTNRYSAYSNYRSYSMAMFGAVKNGSAVLVYWTDPYTVLEVRRLWTDSPLVPGHGAISASLIMKKSARSFIVNTLGKGGYAEIAHAYRAVARERGLLRTWKEKISTNRFADKMLGAANFKPFVFTRLVPHTRYNRTSEEKVYLGYTFQEAANIAEHLRNEVGVDKAMYVLAGWIRRGYDNQHPDILPPASECGGNDGLADCAKRVQALGYLFGLHDNYQDMYKDAPSWSESYIMKNPDGSLVQGGEWAGGLAYLTCSKRALELARRDQNLPSVKRLFSPDIYFIDTTFAAPPYECFDPEHPLSLNDDIYWKRKLSEYARRTFGLFGSEEGQEWAVPCADYFEGIMSHKTQKSDDEIVIPLFPMVYGDCINLYTHQGDRATPDKPEYILHHILYAEMPIYDFGNHLYYQEQGDSRRSPLKASIHSLKQIGPRTFEVTYAWEVKDIPKRDYTCFVHFVDRDSGRPEGIVFQNDHSFTKPTSSWKVGEIVLDGPHIVHVPEDASGLFHIMVGLLDDGARVDMQGVSGVGGRYHIGAVSISDSEIKLVPFTDSGLDFLFFAHNDDSTLSNATDRFIKNTYEILSPLNQITAYVPMTQHEFLTSDRRVERTQFDDVSITVNYGEKPYRTRNAVLPRWGFLVESPTFIAFHGVGYRGISFSKPAMFVVRSKDGRPLRSSDSIHVYRAFGNVSELEKVVASLRKS